MGRVYTASFNPTAQTAQLDIFEILAATGKPILIHGVFISQTTEVGDAQEEGLSILMHRGVGVTTGSGGATPTAAPRDVNDTAAGATVKTQNTTKSTSGTKTTLESHAWNVRAPFEKWWSPETRPRIHPGDRFIVELATTPADSISFAGTIIFEEI